jgi:hypothetical protein
MTQLDTAAPQREGDAAPAGSPSWPLWPFVAALVAAPLLALAGLALEPADAYGSERAMVEAYVGSPGRVDLQATGLHLGFVLAGFGLFGAAAVVRGRGRRLALAGSLLSLLGFGFMSSFLLMDWVTVAVAQETDVATALAVDDRFGGPGLVVAWILPQMVGLLLGPPLVVAGMARAGLLPWWALALPVAVAVSAVVLGNDQLAPYVGFAGFGALGWWIAYTVWVRRPEALTRLR